MPRLINQGSQLLSHWRGIDLKAASARPEHAAGMDVRVHLWFAFGGKGGVAKHGKLGVEWV